MRFWRRIGIAIGGGLLVLVGVILSVPLVPGPGFAVILLGLGVLSLEFERPRIWLAALKRGFRSWLATLKRGFRIWPTAPKRWFKELMRRFRGKSSSGDAS